MKKTLVLFLAAFLAISICACTNGGNESSMLPSSEPPVSSESSVPQTLSFDGMDFTFTVPSRWSKDDYTVKVVKDDVMSSQDIEYSHVDFLFKGNADTPFALYLGCTQSMVGRSECHRRGASFSAPRDF